MQKNTNITYLEYLEKIKSPDLENYDYLEQINEVISVERFLRNFSATLFVADF